jgi:processive 1,2-diacylglycerol beta-glucosyltransferase
MRKVNYALAKTLEKYISMYDPDTIVFTHVLAGILLDDIKLRYGLRAKTIGIVTDFRLHPYWEEVTHLDYVVCADKRMTYSVIKKGFDKEKILPFGIPIHPKFTVEIPKAVARAKLGLDNRLTLLVMGGSMGFGDMVENVKTLDALDIDYQIVVICGNNKNAYEQLSALNTTKKLYVYGFVNNVEMFMSAADLIVTKPGGLTSSEALAKRLPMIIVNPIPGQEERNVEFLLNNGAAIKVSKTFSVDDAVYQLFSNTERLKTLKETVGFLGKPNSTADLVKFILGHQKEGEDGKI